MALGNAHSGKRRKNLPYCITQFTTLEIEAKLQNATIAVAFHICKQNPGARVPDSGIGSPAKSNE
jgi:hypothetical protein